MKDMANTPNSQNEGEICDAVDEYFRQNFRKIRYKLAELFMFKEGQIKNRKRRTRSQIG